MKTCKEQTISVSWVERSCQPTVAFWQREVPLSVVLTHGGETAQLLSILRATTESVNHISERIVERKQRCVLPDLHQFVTGITAHIDVVPVAVFTHLGWGWSDPTIGHVAREWTLHSWDASEPNAEQILGKYFFSSLNTKLLFHNCALSRSCSHSVCCSPDSSRYSGLCCQCDSLASQCLSLWLWGPDSYHHTALRALGSMFLSLLVGAYDLFKTEENSCFELMIHRLFTPYSAKAVLYLQPVIGTDEALLCV